MQLPDVHDEQHYPPSDFTIFLDALASLRPGMTGQNRRIQGALPENPLTFHKFVKYQDCKH